MTKSDRSMTGSTPNLKDLVFNLDEDEDPTNLPKFIEEPVVDIKEEEPTHISVIKVRAPSVSELMSSSVPLNIAPKYSKMSKNRNKKLEKAQKSKKSQINTEDEFQNFAQVDEELQEEILAKSFYHSYFQFSSDDE